MTLINAIVLSGMFYIAGDSLIRLLTDLPDVLRSAGEMLPFAAIYVGLSVPAFQMDGIFIGTTYAREMRNGAIVAVGLFIPASIVLIENFGQSGLWISMLIWILLRGLCLAYYFPAIRRDLS